MAESIGRGSPDTLVFILDLAPGDLISLSRPGVVKDEINSG